MSPRKRTRLQRSHKDHPNQENQKKYVKRIKINAKILRTLEIMEQDKKPE